MHSNDNIRYRSNNPDQLVLIAIAIELDKNHYSDMRMRPHVIWQFLERRTTAVQSEQPVALDK